MTLDTFPDLSSITSLMSPIFSFSSLYTLMPESLDPRHSPTLRVLELVAGSNLRLFGPTLRLSSRRSPAVILQGL